MSSLERATCEEECRGAWPCLVSLFCSSCWSMVFFLHMIFCAFFILLWAFLLLPTRFVLFFRIDGMALCIERRQASLVARKSHIREASNQKLLPPGLELIWTTHPTHITKPPTDRQNLGSTPQIPTKENHKSSHWSNHYYETGLNENHEF